MTQNEMIEMAKQAGWQYAHGESGYEPLWAFAALVASAEREACAKLCDEQWKDAIACGDKAGALRCIGIRTLIQARGNT